MKTTFEHGDLAWLARHTGISKQFLNNALNGRRRLKHHQAEKLSDAATKLGYHTSVFDWMFPAESANPLFAKWSKEGERK